MNHQLIEQLGIHLGANGLPYAIPLHPKLVHLTLGLLIIAILFDLAGNLFRFEQPIFKNFAIPAVRSSFYDVGWYNLVAAAIITVFTVAAGFFEIMLAEPPADIKSDWGLTASQTMILHGIGGILLLGIITGMAAWRGLQRYYWRKDKPKEVEWRYLIVGIALLGLLFLHGTLGAHLGDKFGIHNTAGGLLRQGQNPNVVLK